MQMLKTFIDKIKSSGVSYRRSRSLSFALIALVISSAPLANEQVQVDTSVTTASIDLESNAAIATLPALKPVLRDHPDLERWRSLYSKATAQLERSDIDGYRRSRQKLGDYPLAGYLDYRYHRKFISALDQQALADFSESHNNAYLSRRLKQARLNQLARKQRWPELLAEYDSSLANTRLKCHHARALFYSGEQDEAITAARALWLSPKSQPKSCDPVFHLLVEQDGVDSELAWQRFNMAFGSREIQLAKYLTRFLDGHVKEQAALLLKLYRNPDGIPQRWQDLDKLAISDNSKKQLLQRMARHNAERAGTFAVKLDDSDQALASQLKSYILTRHALRDYNTLPELYQSLDSPRDEKSMQWLLRAHIARADWAAIPPIIEQLPQGLKEQERWRYWTFRSQELAGNLSDEERLAFAALADKPSFYGFITAEQQNRAFSFTPQHSNPSEAELNAIESLPQVQRALEHFYHGELSMARNEWRQASRNFDRETTISSAYLAQQHQWHNQAIVAAITAKSWQHYPLRFPNVYAERFEQQAKQYQLPAEWLYATARQESAFASDARSGAGAMGLMQLMPATAKDVAKSVGKKYRRDKLFEPDYNISLGSYYLADLYEQYDNRALASAAYNAGPHRVKKWLANLQQPIPVDAWIETIRFNETRQYVQNIFSFSLIHSLLYSTNTQDPAMISESEKQQLAFILPNEWQVTPPARELALSEQQDLN